MRRPLILAIEHDPRQAIHLRLLVERLDAELLIADSATAALRFLADRIPDLILTPALLSRSDDAGLTERLLELGEAAAHIQTLTIPLLGGDAPPRPTASGMFLAFRRNRTGGASAPVNTSGAFAQQIDVHLQRALQARQPAADPLPLPEAAVVRVAIDELAEPAPVATPPPASGDLSYFDPTQRRFAALFEKLDEIASGQ